MALRLAYDILSVLKTILNINLDYECFPFSDIIDTNVLSFLAFNGVTKIK